MIMVDESLKAQAEKVIEQLITVKDEFIKNKDELALSIRRDVVRVELKAILQDNKDYNSLRDALETYINNLIVIKGE